MAYFAVVVVCCMYRKSVSFKIDLRQFIMLVHFAANDVCLFVYGESVQRRIHSSDQMCVQWTQRWLSVILSK